jgi:hypothetical protein
MILHEDSMSKSSASLLDFRVSLQHNRLVFSAHDERAIADVNEQSLEYIQHCEKRAIASGRLE